MSVQLNNEEKTQLYLEAEMIKTYHALTGAGRHQDKGKRNCKFIKQKAKHKYHTITCLLEQVWGG